MTRRVRAFAHTSTVAAAVNGLGARTVAYVQVGAGDTWGTGEAAPIRGMAPESERWLEIVEAAVADDGLVGALCGTNDIVRRTGLLEVLAAASPAAACALDVATLDYIARAEGVPLAVLLGGRAHATVPTQPLLTAVHSPEACARVVEAAVARGVRRFKFKIGDDGALARLRACAPFGLDTMLALDANGAGDAATIIDALAPYAQWPVAYCEQPVPPGSIDALPGRLPIAWAADESVAFEPDAVLKCEHAQLVAVVLKPMSLGGPSRSLRFAARATDRGLTVVPSHSFEGPVGFAAACEVAVAYHPLPTHAGLAPYPAVAALPHLGLADHVRSAGAAGHGVATAPLDATGGT